MTSGPLNVLNPGLFAAREINMAVLALPWLIGWGDGPAWGLPTHSPMDLKLEMVLTNREM